MSKTFIVYDLPTQALPAEGLDGYKGPCALFLGEHSDYKAGDTMYYFDPEMKTSRFAALDSFSFGEMTGDGTATVKFILNDGTTKFEADYSNVIKVVGLLSKEARWVEELDHLPEVAVKKIGTDEGVDVYGVFNEYCQHFH